MNILSSDLQILLKHLDWGHVAPRSPFNVCFSLIYLSVMRWWHGYLSEMRCKWFASDPADATATTSFLASLKSRIV